MNKLESFGTQLENGAEEKAAPAGVAEREKGGESSVQEIRELLTERLAFDPSDPDASAAARQVIADHLKKLEERYSKARKCRAFVVAWNLAVPNKPIPPQAAPFEIDDFENEDSILAFLRG